MPGTRHLLGRNQRSASVALRAHEIVVQRKEAIEILQRHAEQAEEHGGRERCGELLTPTSCSARR